MNRQSVTRDQKPNNSTFLPSTILQHNTINRVDYGLSTIDIRNPSEQQIDKLDVPGAGSHHSHDFSKIPVRLNSTYPIQAKLKIGRSNDKYEQEADRVADQVMRMPDPGLSSSFGGSSSLANRINPHSRKVQRACASCSEKYSTAQEEKRPVESANLCPKCQAKQHEVQQSKQINSSIQARTSEDVTPTINTGMQSLQGGGRSMTEVERSFFEPRFGADFSNVRVHNDTRAVGLAQSVNARAFTLGHNVVFGAGEYSPDSLDGRKLFAHELTHVVQQNESMIQRQEQPDVAVNQDISPDPDETPAPRPTEGSTRVNRCYTNPEFPNFPCLVSALKLDIDENLRNNAHQFYRTASLFPDDNERMWNTFQRYGLGINLLQTSFGFLGANETLGTALSFGTGIGLKSYDFFQNGVLELDLPIQLGRDVKLDLQLDLKADPNNLSNVTSASAGVGISGSF